jgi:hypothetical protein
VLHLLATYLDHTRQRLARALDRRRRGDTGALNTLELVVLGLGIVAIAAAFVTVVREAVNSRLDQLR